MNSFEKKQINNIEKRMEYLQKRIDDKEKKNQPCSFDRSELISLKWALEIIMNWFNKEEENIKDEQE